MFDPDELDEEVERKLGEYEKVFPQGFPLMSFEGNKEKLIKTIDKCIRKNKTYKPKYEDGWDY